VAKVVANAPSDLDTLKEIADYIESDKTGAAQMVTQIDANAKAISAEMVRAQEAEAALGKAIDTKVDAEKGKGLSSNDYTNEEKAKLGKTYSPDNPPPEPDLSGYAKKSDIPSLDDYAKTADVLPRYEFADAAIIDGVVTVAPYTNAKLESDGTAFSVAVGGKSGYMRDCVLRVECGETAPKITWGNNFHPRTDAETDFTCVAGVRNVYWISEYAYDEFVVAGWQETEGGNAE
jgi:hypothetical protein